MIDLSDALEDCRVYAHRPIRLRKGHYRLTRTQVVLHTRRRQSNSTATVNQLR